MTSPDRHIPAPSNNPSVNSYGIAAYAAKTQADWENEMRATISPRFSQAELGFGRILDLIDGIPGLSVLVNNLFGTTDPATTTGSQILESVLPQVDIGGSSNTIVQHIQDAVDNAVSALFGGSGTGYTTSDINSGLLAIPAGNIVGLVGGGTVAYGATGGGSSTGTSSSNSISVNWSHTIGGSDNYVVTAVFTGAPYVAYSGVTRTVTYGTQSMSSLGVKPYYWFGWQLGWVELWGLANPASGAQTVTATSTKSGSTFRVMIGDSVSYSNWSATSTTTTNSGSGTTSVTTGAVTSGATHVAVGCLVCTKTGTSTLNMSSFSQTSRYSVADVYNSTFGVTALILGDATGASSPTFSATASSTSDFVAIAVDLS